MNKLTNMLSKDMINLLNENNMKIDDFISESASFKNHYFIRHTKKANELYKKACQLNIIIWSFKK